MKTSIVVPLFNEVSTVNELLTRVVQAPMPVGVDKEIIIVESNSTDGTRLAVQNFLASERNGPIEFKLVLQEKPKGKGNAVRAGFENATGDFIIIQDGDLEYDVNEYPLLLQPLIDGKSQVVVGSRHLSAGSWKIRKFDQTPVKASIYNFAGIFFHGYFNLMFWSKVTDPTTMFKVFRRDCLSKITLVGDRFEFDLELLGKLILAGYTPYEVPVSYNSRGVEEGKKIRFFQDGYLCMLMMTRCRIEHTLIRFLNYFKILALQIKNRIYNGTNCYYRI